MFNYQMPYQNNLDWIYVQKTTDVDSVNVVPNTRAWIMVQDEPIFALKTADQIGRTNTDYYKFEKTDPVKKSEYVTMDQLEKLLNELKEKNDEPTDKQSTAK